MTTMHLVKRVKTNLVFIKIHFVNIKKVWFRAKLGLLIS